MWLSIFGVPVLAWNKDFFKDLAECFGSFICIDAQTEKEECYDIARVMINVDLDYNLTERMVVNIDRKEFHLVLWEDKVDSLRLNLGNCKTQIYGFESTDSEGFWSNEM